jgi:TM2 domain-containing membrane protein YozV
MSQYPNYGAQDPSQPDPANPYSQPAAPSSGGYSYPTSGAPGYQPTSGAPGYDPAYQQQQAGYPVQAGYPQQGYAQAAYDPQGRPYSDKTKLVAGLLGIFLGGFGVGRFYTGHTGLGVAQLLVSVFTCGFGALWGLIDGILILVNGGTDAQGRVLRDS